MTRTPLTPPPPPASAAAALRALRRAADAAHAAVLQRFFKTGSGEYGEGDRFLGIRVPALRRLTRDFESLPRPELRVLLASRWHEARLLALLILVRQYQHGDSQERDRIFQFYMRSAPRVNNWDLVDCSAPQIAGPHLLGKERPRLAALARSPNVWERRIAVLATFYGIRQGEFRPALQVAAILIDDPHDLIHKAVGWMLREIGKPDQQVEEQFLRLHATHMPRTMLRYAIERFPEPLRRRYLRATLDGG